MSFGEIAAELGMTKGQVSGIVYRQQRAQEKPKPKSKILPAGVHRPKPRSTECREPVVKSVAQIIGEHLIKYKLQRRGFYVSEDREPKYINLLIAGHDCVEAGRLAMRGKRLNGGRAHG